MSASGDTGDVTSSTAERGPPRQLGRRRGDRLIGASPVTQRVIEQAAAAARSELPVLLTGAPRSGKAFLARAIHAWSESAAQPFAERSCTALPEALQAREIFGCGADVHALVPAQYDGALSQAAGGTLLLRQADRLRPAVRDALMQALTEGSFSREGETARTPLRARLIATGESAPNGGPFGSLPHHRISIAPLAERPEDILPLAAHFLSLFSGEIGHKPVGFTEEARASLLREAWSGNVGELRERIRQALALAGDGAISAEALLLARDGADVPSFKEAKRAFETRYVTGLLRRCRGNISRAARLAKKDRKDFYDVIRRTGVDPSAFRE